MTALLIIAGTWTVCVGTVPSVAFAPGTVSPPITAICLLPDNESILAASDAGLFRYQSIDDKHPRQLDTSLEKILMIRVSPDRKRIVLVGGIPGEAGEVEIWDVQKLSKSQHFDVDDDVILDAAWRSSQQLIVGGMTGRYTLLDLDQPDKDLTQINAHSKGILTLQPIDENCIASAGLDFTIRTWCQDSKRQRVMNNHSGAVNDLALRPNASGSAKPMLASASEDLTVRFWQPTIGRMVRFVQLESAPECIDWTPDGRQLIAACRNSMLVLIDPETVEVKGRFESRAEAINCLQITSDGQAILGTGSGMVSVNLR